MKKRTFLPPSPVYSLSSFFLLLLMALCLFAVACGFEPDSLPDPVPDPPQPVWTLVYNANGGEGTMPPSTATENTAQKLSPNTFTRTYCTFAGWAETKAGTMEYADEESVPGQAAEKTLTLYALWDIESGQEGAVVKTATSGGNTITLTGVAWSPGLKGAVESALSDAGMTLNLSGVSVSGLAEWDKDTLGSAKANIKSLVLPDTVTSLKDAADPNDVVFNGYTSLESVSGAGVTKIGDHAFFWCTKLTKVELPEAKTVGVGAFQLCTNLAEVKFLGATAIGDSAFQQCTNLAEVELPAVADIGDSAFSECINMAKVELPKAAAIGGYAFHSCTNLAEVKLPAVADIGHFAFYSCTNLAEVELPAAENIGGAAFFWCTKLTKVELPLAKNIGNNAFYNCKALAELFLPANPPTLGSSVFTLTDSSVTLNIYVGLGNVPAYTGSSGWDVSAATLANGNTAKYGNNHKAITIME